MAMRVLRIAAMVAVAMGWAAARAEVSCSAAAKQVIGQRWDAVLGRGWTRVANCAHPEGPARLVAATGASARAPEGGLPAQATGVAAAALPLVVHAGDAVRLWQQAERVRIEMTGVAEQAARIGERVVVRLTRQTDGEGLQVERMSGVVRGAGDVEMER